MLSPPRFPPSFIFRGKFCASIPRFLPYWSDESIYSTMDENWTQPVGPARELSGTCFCLRFFNSRPFSPLQPPLPSIQMLETKTGQFFLRPGSFPAPAFFLRSSLPGINEDTGALPGLLLFRSLPIDKNSPHLGPGTLVIPLRCSVSLEEHRTSSPPSHSDIAFLSLPRRAAELRPDPPVYLSSWRGERR